MGNKAKQTRSKPTHRTHINQLTKDGAPAAAHIWGLVPWLAAIAVALIAVALAVTHGAMGTGAQDGVCTPPLARKLQGVKGE